MVLCSILLVLLSIAALVLRTTPHDAASLHAFWALTLMGFHLIRPQLGTAAAAAGHQLEQAGGLVRPHVGRVTREGQASGSASQPNLPCRTPLLQFKISFSIRFLMTMLVPRSSTFSFLKPLIGSRHK